MRERLGRWNVWWAPGAPRPPLAEALRAFERGQDPSDATVVKQSAVRRVVRTALAGNEAVFWKRYRVRSRRERLRFVAGRSRARQEFVNLLRVQALGIEAVEALLCAERREGAWLAEALLATREAPGAQRLEQVLVARPPAAARGLLEALARLAWRLHDAGLWHRDLHGGNVLVAPAAQGERLVLVDLQKMRRLPIALPQALRVRDLAALHDEVSVRVGEAEAGHLVGAYLAAGSGSRTARASFARRVERAAARRARRRLRSRGRRCVVNSTGFRVERVRAYRIYRRADVPRESVLECVEAHRRRAAADDAVTCVPDVLGGPPPGPARRPYDRGHGAPEAGAPARAAVEVRELGARGPGAWLGRHPAMRAWRQAHASLLLGIDVPAPLALVEELRFGVPTRGFLLLRAPAPARAAGHRGLAGSPGGG